MKLDSQGIAFIRQQEGSERKMYRDQIGSPTIGVGHLLTKDELSSGKLHINGEWIKWHEGLTDAQVDILLNQDSIHVENAINSDGLKLTQYQFNALVDFAFNEGTGAYGRSTLRKKLLLGKYDEIPDELRKWVYAGGMMVPDLKERREAEIALWTRLEVRAAE